MNLTTRLSRLSGLFFWLILSLLAGLFYLALARMAGYTGFPLDDAWIHQTYARNLAQTGQMAFVPGISSAGSTAPLWTVLLSIGYALGLPYHGWTYGLGMLFLGFTGWTVARLGRRLFHRQPQVGIWAGVFCVLEWHLVWAAVSGMETILFIWLSLLLVERYLAIVSTEEKQTPKFLGVGVLGGLLILTRPEGAGWVGLIGLDFAYRWRQSSSKNIMELLRVWGAIIAGVGILLVPYLLFHLWLVGQPLPNTFYAKQAEYGIILQAYPLWWRLFGGIGPTVESVQGVFRVIFIGPQILLIPGLIFAAWLTFKERRSELALLWLWWVGYLLLYAVMLPVTYQHGRYQIPAIPWVILLGVWGTMAMLSLKVKRRGLRLILRVVRPVLVLSLGLLVTAFMVLGAQAYARDVRFIETEMVVAAKWLDRHASPEALLAAHDIGAVGYFTQRPLIDLAGLVTPEIIPIIRNEPALLEFITTRQADYLVTFPSWYPDLARSPHLTLLYTTGSPWSVQAGGDNMAVYQVTSAE